ncbi:MAG TPA: hypothetical protein VF408_08345 [Sediminibacterium sp.]
MSVTIQCCAHCSKQLHGRTDKRFCNDHCRNDFHNRQNAIAAQYMRQINRNLKKNRRILSSLLSARQSARIHINRLQEQGFAFGYFTHIHTTRTGLLYFYCYELGYAKIRDEQVMIRKVRNCAVSDQ